MNDYVEFVNLINDERAYYSTLITEILYTHFCRIGDGGGAGQVPLPIIFK